jgi:hypothetical protein
MEDEQANVLRSRRAGDPEVEEVQEIGVSSTASASQTSKRERVRRDFPWEFTYAWDNGDPVRERGKVQCSVCCKWFTNRTNASGWKLHLFKQHNIQGLSPDGAPSTSGKTDVPHLRQTQLSKTMPPRLMTHFENSIVNYVIKGEISLRAAGGKNFEELVLSLTGGYGSISKSLESGYKPPSTRTITRRILELFEVMTPVLAQFLNTLNVAVSLTLDGWTNRNLTGFWPVTIHWVDRKTARVESMLLTILEVTSGTGVGNRIANALFDFISRVGTPFMKRIMAVVTDNGSDATKAVKTLFMLVNKMVGIDQLRDEYHVRCTDHSVQICVTKILILMKESTAKLRGACVSIRQSKVLRQEFRREAEHHRLNRKEPTHQDSPTRWNSTNEMCSDGIYKRIPFDIILSRHSNVLGDYRLSGTDWNNIESLTCFLRLHDR